MYVHSYSWDIDTYSIALNSTGDYFPSLRVFAGEAKFWASSCRQNGTSQLALMLMLSVWNLFFLAVSPLPLLDNRGRYQLSNILHVLAKSNSAIKNVSKQVKHGNAISDFQPHLKLYIHTPVLLLRSSKFFYISPILVCIYTYTVFIHIWRLPSSFNLMIPV